MRKGRNGGKKREKKTGEKRKEIRMKIVATTSLPAVDRPNAYRWNAARSRQKKREKNGVFSGHYVIASSLLPERLRPNDDCWNAARSCQFNFQ